MGAAAASRRRRASPRNSGVGEGSGWGSWTGPRRGEEFGGGMAGGGEAARPAGALGAGGWPAAPAFAVATEAGEAAGQVGFEGFACACYGTVKLGNVNNRACGGRRW